MKDFIGGIVLSILGLVILALAIFATKDLTAGVIGGLFAGAGVMWIVLTIIEKGKKDKYEIY